ncbi:protein PSK SIMULATOR 1-like [Rosa rugosa]|uniref:protein PSK SIMULATOR 1-like n=1 Tax=Rosa rugosa TaxID=74645 RepID=UPI002B40A8DA|nr:protein PSK SIMULATOR 1-like [Rosa rugosa]
MMKEFISKNTDLYDKMKLLSDLEHTLKDITATLDGPILLEFQNKVELKRHEVENLKEVSLWNTTYDYVGILLATSVFTIISRIKHVFGLPKLITDAETKDSDHISPSPSIFSKHKLLDAPPDTLGAAALALHYANIILKIETLLYPSRCHRVDRNDLYSMLPGSIRAELNERLPCIEGSTLSLPCIESTTSALQDLPKLEESIQATIKTIEWVSPLAHNMKKWQSKWNIQQKAQKASVFSHPVLLVQTLYFANHQKTEATITDLLVGMHYTYNLKRQVKAKSMLERGRNSLKIKAANLEAQDEALVSIDGDQTV